MQIPKVEDIVQTAHVGHNSLDVGVVWPTFPVQGVLQWRKTLADPVIAVMSGSFIAASAGGAGGYAEKRTPH